MIFGTPISWFINEMIAAILLLVCIAHAVRREKPIVRLLELFCYMLTAGIFENIGVWRNVYYYSVDRIMMFGKVPLSILFMEGVILYAAMLLVEHLRLPKWAMPLGVGVLASIQDMTLDPSSVFDLHNISGVMEGQWNWTKHYAGGFVDIPYFNFSGWMTMMVFYTAAILIGRRIYEKKRKDWIGIAYPIAATAATLLLLVSPVNQFLLYAMPFAEMNNKTAELTMLIINFTVSIFFLLKFARYDKPFAGKQDKIMLYIPAFLHVYAFAGSIILGISAAILPITIVALIHCGYLFLIYRKCRRRPSSSV